MERNVFIIHYVSINVRKFDLELKILTFLITTDVTNAC